MKLYLDSGYLNIAGIRESAMAQGLPFIFIVGGRGTGKTFGALENVYTTGERFMFMRRTQTQLEQISRQEYSPFKAVNEYTGGNIVSAPISKYTCGYYHAEEQENGKMAVIGAPIGYTCALSTISNLRGFDASDVKVLIYDEFIPERHERPIKNESAALFNAYETINRNRELKGEPPLQMLCLANANDLGNNVFLDLGLVRIAENMRKKKREVWTDPKRGIMLIILQASPISSKKRHTALYKLTDGTEFSEMSLDNNFADEDAATIRSMPVSEYKPVCRVGEITIYRHKAKREYYVSSHHTGSPPVYGAGEIELTRFKRAFQWVWLEYLKDNIIFEEKVCEILLTRYFD